MAKEEGKEDNRKDKPQGPEQKQASERPRQSAASNGQTKEGKARELLVQFKKVAEEQKKIAEARQTSKKGKDLDRDEVKWDKKALQLAREAKGLIPEQEWAKVEKVRTDFVEAQRKQKPVDFRQEREAAEQNKREAKDAASELAAVVVVGETERLERADQKRQKELARARQEIEREARGSTKGFREILGELEDLQNLEPLDRRVREKEVKAEFAGVIGRAVADGTLAAELEARDSWQEMANEGQGMIEIQKKVYGDLGLAQKKAEDEETVDDPNTGLGYYYLLQEANIFFQNLMGDPQYEKYARYQQDLERDRLAIEDMASRYRGAETGAEREALGGQIKLLSQRYKERQMGMPDIMGRGGVFYEPLPEDQDDWQDWVLEKLSEIDTSKVSPGMLTWFPAWTSLLYAAPELSTKAPEIAAQISAWRSLYEFWLVYETAGSPGDISARSSEIDPDVFTGLIGNYLPGEKPGDKVWLRPAEKIQEAVAMLDERGEEFVMGKDPAGKIKGASENRARIMKEVAEKLDDPYGMLFTRIAYRYWRAVFSRDAHFDRVKIDDEDNLLGQGKIEDGKGKSERYDVGPEGDKIAAGKYIGKRYDGYKGSAKFCVRRLFNAPEALRQEKNIKFQPERFDRMDYGITDYYTAKILSGDQRKGLKDGGFDKDKCVKHLTVDLLKNTDWENRTATFGVWAYNVACADKTRSLYIKPGGILNNADYDPKTLYASKEVNEQFDDKEDTVLVGLARAELESRKGRILPRFIVEKVRLPETEEYIDWKGDKKIHNRESTFPHIRLSWSRSEDETGVETASWGRGEMEDNIDRWRNNGFISKDKAEELKREYLGFDFWGLAKIKREIVDPETGERKYIDYPIIPGVLPVRIAMRFASAAPSTFLGIFFAMLGKFLETVLPKEAGFKAS